MVLSQIFIYPIKSARGVTVSETPVCTSGPLQDRRWMLVDRDGLFLSQRRLPQMALLSPRFDDSDLVVEAPGMPPLLIRRWSGEGDWLPVRLWQDCLRLPHPNSEYSEWFSSFLHYPCRLVHLPSIVTRPVEPPFHSSEWSVSLADGYPLLLLSQASLDGLNQRLRMPVGIERFRPNLVITGAAAHEEDGWRRLRIGDVELAVVKACARCSVVLVHPDTGERGVEPLQTLARYRRNPHKVFFAQNALVTTPGLLQTGSAVEILETAN